MRTPLIAANWKMHKSADEAVSFARTLKDLVKGLDGIEITVAPPFTALAALSGELAGSSIALAAQNCHPEAQGAFTGEVAVGMLAGLGCRHVIVGHSERRALFGETSGFVAEKVRAVQTAGLVPIVCVGESLGEREAEHTFQVIGVQLEESLEGASERLVIAYEPVWAIGTGRTATPELAQEVHSFVRSALQERFGAPAAEIRILYGGSVKPGNAAELLAQPDIDGALVGGASLDPESFSAIIRSGAKPAEKSP